MNQNLRSFLKAIVLSVGLAGAVFSPTWADVRHASNNNSLTMLSTQYAASILSVDCSNGTVSQSAVCQGQTSSNPITGPNGSIRKAANVIALIGGLIAIITIIIAGLRYMTSNGDPTKIQGARSALIFALVGIAVIVLADSIIGLVLNHI